MMVTQGEQYEFKLYHRKENSDYQWEESPYLVFKGKPANQAEVKNYRIQKGVNGNTDSVFIQATYLPTSEIKIKDKVYFLGKMWTVESIGYYFDSNRIINPRLMSEEQIIERCPKGLNIQ